MQHFSPSSRCPSTTRAPTILRSWSPTRCWAAAPARGSGSASGSKTGLSYGVYATLRPSSFEPNTPILIEAIFAPDNQERLRAALADVLTRAVRDGFTATEVAEAKAALLQQRKLARTQDPALAAGLVQQAYLDRTFAYAAKIDAALAAVTPAEVNAALRKYVKPDAFAFVYAGDFAKKK